jgi:hypothetical protein
MTTIKGIIGAPARVTASAHQFRTPIANEQDLMCGTSRKLCLKRITHKQAITTIAMNKNANRKQKLWFGKLRSQAEISLKLTAPNIPQANSNKQRPKLKIKVTLWHKYVLQRKIQLKSLLSKQRRKQPPKSTPLGQWP